MHPPYHILSPDWPQYELLDTGHRRKLERVGRHILIRGEPKAWWPPVLPQEQWATLATATHHEDSARNTQGGRWQLKAGQPRQWEVPLAYPNSPALTLSCAFHENKHVGVFPEQEPHWRHLAHVLGGASSGRLLNLFGYTGVASLVAAACGFHVTHVDASKPAIAWARQNQELSGLAEKPIRWILEDAFKYCQREVRRGARYDAILLDPPSYGRGPKGELWRVEEQLPRLLSLCRELLSDRPLLLLLTLYSLEASALMAANLVTHAMEGLGGKVVCGELALTPAHGSACLPLSLWARWDTGQ